MVVVMFYLKNPYGRIIVYDFKEKRDWWLDQPGFTIPTNEEVSIWLAYRERQRREQKALADRLDVTNGSGIYLATVTPGTKDGYGIASVNIAQQLESQGIHVSYNFTGQPIGLLFHAPYSIMRVPSQYRIIYTMFESTKIPASWHDYLTAAQKILVPSKWCQKVFLEGGFETEVVPLGYDDTFFTYKPHINKRDAHQNFVFLHYNAYNIRKGFIEVFNAFVREFGPDEPVELVLKTNLQKPPIPFNPSQYPNIKVITGDMPEYMLADLCQKSDCFVFPSRGEGFGQTPLEAMATGLPVIVPNAHGISEYFNPDCMYEVEVESMCKAIYRRYKDEDTGEMYVSSVKDLRAKMRYVYEHQDEAIAKGKLAAEYAKTYTYKQTGKRLKQVIDEILSKPLPERRSSNVLSLELI